MCESTYLTWSGFFGGQENGGQIQIYHRVNLNCSHLLKPLDSLQNLEMDCYFNRPQFNSCGYIAEFKLKYLTGIRSGQTYEGTIRITSDQMIALDNFILLTPNIWNAEIIQGTYYQSEEKGIFKLTLDSVDSSLISTSLSTNLPTNLSTKSYFKTEKLVDNQSLFNCTIL